MWSKTCTIEVAGPLPLLHVVAFCSQACPLLELFCLLLAGEAPTHDFPATNPCDMTVLPAQRWTSRPFIPCQVALVLTQP